MSTSVPSPTAPLNATLAPQALCALSAYLDNRGIHTGVNNSSTRSTQGSQLFINWTLVYSTFPQLRVEEVAPPEVLTLSQHLNTSTFSVDTRIFKVYKLDY